MPSQYTPDPRQQVTLSSGLSSPPSASHFPAPTGPDPTTRGVRFLDFLRRSGMSGARALEQLRGMAQNDPQALFAVADFIMRRSPESLGYAAYSDAIIGVVNELKGRAMSAGAEMIRKSGRGGQAQRQNAWEGFGFVKSPSAKTNLPGPQTRRDIPYGQLSHPALGQSQRQATVAQLRTPYKQGVQARTEPPDEGYGATSQTAAQFRTPAQPAPAGMMSSRPAPAPAPQEGYGSPRPNPYVGAKDTMEGYFPGTHKMSVEPGSAPKSVAQTIGASAAGAAGLAAKGGFSKKSARSKGPSANLKKPAASRYRAASAGDKYEAMFTGMYSQAVRRANANKGAGQAPWVPLRDYKNNKIFLVMADGNALVFDVTTGTDISRYRTALLDSGYNPNATALVAEEASKPLLMAFIGDKTAEEISGTLDKIDYSSLAQGG